MVRHDQDKALARRLVAGDAAAFDEFFDDYSDRLYRFVLPRLHADESAAQDVVQATLIRATTRMHQYRGEAALFTWVCTIARHETADWIARQRRYRDHVVLIEDHDAIRAALDSQAATEGLEPERGFERLETIRRIQVALDNLPVRYARALVWKYVQGFSVKEIAARLDLGTEAAQSLLARAKRAFAEAYRTLHTDDAPDSGALT